MLRLRASHLVLPRFKAPSHTDVIQRKGISKAASKSRRVSQ
jgi:hypothetical protein